MASNNKKTISLGLDFSQFDGGLSEINRKMGLLDAEFKFASESAKGFGDATTQLELKQQQLTQKIILQTNKVELAKQAYDKAMASGTATAKTIDNLDKSLLTQRATLEKLKNELTDTASKLDESKKSTESFGDSIRGMASSIGLEVSPAIETLASKFDGMDKNVGNAIFGIGALITTFASFTISAANMADDLLTLSSVTGITTDELQKMQYASKFLDVEVETMTNSMTKLTRNMDDARNGSKELDSSFGELKVRYKDTSGQLLNVNDVFYNTIDALGRVKNETERDALAMNLLGKSAKELNPLIEAGSARLKELGVEAKNMGTVMDKEALDKLGKMKDAMDKMENTSDALKNSLGLALLPVLTGLFEAIGKIPVPVLQTLIVLGSVVTTIVLLVKAVKTVTDTTAGIKGFFTGINASSIKTIGIVIGVVAALIALGTIIAVIAGKSKDLQNSIGAIGESVGQVTGAVTGAQEATAKTVANTGYVMKKSDLGNTYFAPERNNSSVTRNFASGTDNFQGGETWVNDGGKPELIELPDGSKIYNGNDTEKMLSGDTYITVNVNTKEIDDINKVIKVFNELKQTSRQGRIVHG